MRGYSGAWSPAARGEARSPPRDFQQVDPPFGGLGTMLCSGRRPPRDQVSARGL